MNDKKKLMIVAALGAVMVTVGAFQFLAGGSPQPKPEAKKETSSDVKTASTEGGAEASGEQSSETGAQTKAEGTKAEVAKAEGAKTEGEGTEGEPTKPGEAADPLAAITRVAVRDPFDGRAWTPKAPGAGSFGTGPTPAPAQPSPRPNGGIRLPKIPPFNPGPADINKEGGLPIPTAGGMPPAGGMPSVEDVEYEVAGTIRGSHQAAVFKDSSGNQRLVKAGDKLDGDTRVLSVSNGKVTVRHRGKVKVLKVSDSESGSAKSGSGSGSKGNGDLPKF